MSRNIVEVHFSTPPEGNNIIRLDRSGGVCERIHPDRLLGQHSLQVHLVGDLQADREILIAYGARHGLKERKRPRPKLNKKLKKRSSGVGEAAGDACGGGGERPWGIDAHGCKLRDELRGEVWQMSGIFTNMLSRST